MNMLFQEFIVNVIMRHRAGVLPPSLRDCDLLPQSHGAVQHLARRVADGGAVFPLYPDLAFRAGDHFPLLLDTKYKPLKPASARLGVSPDDFYQMFTYAQRYACPHVLLIYPQVAGDPPLRQIFELQSTAHHDTHGAAQGAAQGAIHVATVNLQVDLSAQRSILIAELKAILIGAMGENLGDIHA
jgi:5-methylcytosine-specific restriction enzyme subunit McrC